MPQLQSKALLIERESAYQRRTRIRVQVSGVGNVGELRHKIDAAFGS
jgi:hypothetical protein